MTTIGIAPKLDQAAVEAFGDRMIGILNDACTALMTSIGHQTGLFDALADRRRRSPARTWRSAPRLNERYVREWLGAMTTGRVVDHDPTSGLLLPPEHAAWLTAPPARKPCPHHAVHPHAGEVEQDIVECFREGGGLSYDRLTRRFHALMAEDSAAFVRRRTNRRGRAARRRADRPAARRDRRRRHRLRQRPRDQRPGAGVPRQPVRRASTSRRRRSPSARAEAAKLGLTNARFEVRDVATLDEPEAFDLVTAFDAVHDQAHPGQVLAAIARALRPGGIFLMVDIKASSNVEDNIDMPWAPFLYTVSTMHCMTVSLALGGDGLGTAWGDQLATSMLHEAGFTERPVQRVEDDPFNNYYVCRK